MKYFPLFAALHDARCVIVGGGEVAHRKVLLLGRAGARITVIAPQLVAGLTALCQQGRISHLAQTFTPEVLDGARLVVAATDDQQVNVAVAAEAQRRQLLINVVDQPQLCNFIFPSIVDRSPVVVAVSTGGASPVLARLLRARLETLIPAAYGRLATLLERYRHQVKQRYASSEQRRRFWERILSGPVAEQVFSGHEQQAAQLIEQALHDPAAADHRGEVYLVGAGPGDPDLLTFRALRLMQSADVVLYDRLVAAPILDLVRREAERIYVGKKRDFHAVRQHEISQMMVDLARQGKRVLRLKGGDPFIFGRGGEEIELLAQQQIPFQVVPGITAASGCASYAGIPLTHRDHAQSVLFVTGHLKDGQLNLDWQHLVAPAQTIVIYMGLHGLDVLCEKLIEHGMRADMPVAIVEQGTTLRQRVVTGTLTTLPGMVRNSELHAPTLIIVGDVVGLHQTLAWFHPQR
ncbi:MAG: uroporphyrinogen-III C-methyltransferase [Gammaproteobacteria bacterium]|nr:uroporphyrinogen-III C-methyltransferase [Gammaproteobacteria bacterium]